MYRDPRDQICSWLKRGRTRHEFNHVLLNYYNRISNDLRFFYEVNYSHKINYEQLVFHPIDTLKEFLDFIKCPSDLKLIEASIQTVLRTGKVGHWISFFNEENEAIFKKLGGDITSYLSYESDENWTYKEYLGNENITEEEYWKFKQRKLLR